MAGIVGRRGMMGLTDRQISAVRRAFGYGDPDGDEKALDLAAYLSFRPRSLGQAECEVKLLLACRPEPGPAAPAPTS